MGRGALCPWVPVGREPLGGPAAVPGGRPPAGPGPDPGGPVGARGVRPGPDQQGAWGRHVGPGAGGVDPPGYEDRPRPERRHQTNQDPLLGPGKDPDLWGAGGGGWSPERKTQTVEYAVLRKYCVL